MTGAIVFISLLTVSGCVSAGDKIKEALSTTKTVTSTTATAVAAAGPQTPAQLAASLNAKAAATRSKQDGYRDPMVSNAASGQPGSALDSPPSPALPGAATTQQASIGGLVMQPTSVNANRSSIYSTTATAYTQPIPASTADAAYAAPQPLINSGMRSIYSTPTANIPSAAAQQSGATLPSDQSSQNIAPQPQAQQTASAAPVVVKPNGKVATLNGQQALAIARMMTSKGQKPIGGGAVLPPNASGVQLTPGMEASLKQPIAAKGADMQPLISNAVYSRKDMAANGNSLVQFASMPAMTRGAAAGLQLQNDKVQVACFKPALTAKLKDVEAHFGKPVMVTSGYRDHAHNEMVGGSEESLHTSCDAADIQVSGVSKWDLASYLRSLPGRGGVGTYCHTASVHVDTGSARDWNWGCNRA